MDAFCTYCDVHYLPRGLALYQSLRQHCPAFQLWVLCLDRASYDLLSRFALPEVRPIALEDFERADTALLGAKQNRKPIEYYFTCTPSLPLFILDHFPAVDRITYLDADLFFFADPAPVFTEIGDRSIAIVEHRFPASLQDRERFGIYNVGWVSFRRDARALACLQWWRQRCIEWCYDRVEDGRFADQKYLDDWPTRFEGVAVVRHQGANVAPWNVARYDVRREGRRVRVDGDPLVFFHFHALRQIKRWLYDPDFGTYGLEPSAVLRRSIYGPYVRALSAATRDVARLLPGTLHTDSIRGQTIEPEATRLAPPSRTLAGSLSRLSDLGSRILHREYLVAIGRWAF